MIDPHRAIDVLRRELAVVTDQLRASRLQAECLESALQAARGRSHIDQPQSRGACVDTTGANEVRGGAECAGERANGPPASSSQSCSYLPPLDFLPRIFVEEYIDVIMIIDKYAQLFHRHHRSGRGGTAASTLAGISEADAARSRIGLLEEKVAQLERQVVVRDEHIATLQRKRHDEPSPGPSLASRSAGRWPRHRGGVASRSGARGGHETERASAPRAPPLRFRDVDDGASRSDSDSDGDAAQQRWRPIDAQRDLGGLASARGVETVDAATMACDASTEEQQPRQGTGAPPPTHTERPLDRAPRVGGWPTSTPPSSLDESRAELRGGGGGDPWGMLADAARLAREQRAAGGATAAPAV